MRGASNLLESQTATVVFFFTLLLAYAYPLQPLGPNEMSRYDFVRAIVDDHTLTIDRYHENTIDKGLFNGHYYSDKAFGLAATAIPIYIAVRAIDAQDDSKPLNDFGVLYFLVLATVAVPSAMLAVVLVKAVALLGHRRAALPVASAFALGTIAFPFSTMFFGHQTASLLAFSSAYLLMRFRRSATEEKQGGAWRTLAAGLLAGAASLFEYPVGIVSVLLFAYVLLCFRHKMHAVAFLAGLVPAGAAIAGYNYILFGHPLNLSYSFTAAANFPAMSRGLMGVSWPELSVLWQLLFAGKGLLVNSPILLLSAIGLYLMLRLERDRPEALLCAAVAMSFLIYNSGGFNPFGGATPGPRYLVPALPFMALPLAAVFNGSSILRAMAAQLASWSIVIMSSATMSGPLASEQVEAPFVTNWAPAVLQGRFVYNIGQWFFKLDGLWSLLPFAVVVAIGLTAVSVVPFLSPRRFTDPDQQLTIYRYPQKWSNL